jgi:predicted phosphoribosyltransferase
MATFIEDRSAAGLELGGALEKYRGPDTLVLAVPCGGVPVASEIARVLEAPLDIVVVHRLRLPGLEHYSLGAMAERSRVLNWGVVSGLDVSDEAIEDLAQAASVDIDRLTRLYRANRIAPSLDGRTIILVDDGIVTGGTIRAAIGEARAQRAARIVLAIGAAPFDALEELRPEVDDIVCIDAPHPFRGLDRCYWNYPAISDREVCEVLVGRWTVDDLRATAHQSLRALRGRGGALSTEDPATKHAAARGARLRRVPTPTMH